MTATGTPGPEGRGGTDEPLSGTARRAVVVSEEVSHVVAGTRLIGALIAESLANLEPPITMPQWRVLVLATKEDCNVSAVADDLGVHMSNATRICDWLVTAGLLERRRADHDKRQVLLRHTCAGQALYGRAMEFRRQRIEHAMRLVSAEDRAALAESFERFIEAAERARMTSGNAG